ncbi:MAG: histidine phosphatase family protein [Desulfobacteraceae bacterium]|nr:histidine phosphatase family protein [Desulfobacteraceae bacterium]
MKTIILVRHAKSSWKNASLDDFDRPLNKRGKMNAPFMGEKLQERRIMPDLILSSPAKRARKTAVAVAKAIGYPKKKIIFDEKIYHASAWYLFEMVRNLDDDYETIMLFGHNPGFNDFADILLKKNPVDNIPTTGVYCIRFNVDRWENVRDGKGESVFFDYPRQYQDEWV